MPSRSRRSWRPAVGAVAAVGRIAALFLLSLVGSPATIRAADKIEFARDVQPILAARCWGCHGDSDAEGGLRLTDRAAVTGEDEAGLAVVVPGDPAASSLLLRVLATDEEERMPPEGPPLSPAEVSVLRRWIAEGADWPDHWAYAVLRRPAVPKAGDDWARNPIDRFIAAKREAVGLSAAPPADRATWLRRVSFDLLGLPPTLDQLADFLADADPFAEQRIVDRLLADPAHGERQARHWMDWVHFAETHGHDQDRPRDHAWPYRDYLISSFNDDVPYGRFVREQVAGDVLFPGDPRALVATGFLAAGPWDESSLRDIREDTADREIARYLDRDDIVTNVLATFLSTTIHCARCHDHKFDPISLADYYNLQAVFAATDKANRNYDADPTVARRRIELETALAELPGRLAAADPTLENAGSRTAAEAWFEQWRQADSLWRVSQLTRLESDSGGTLTELADGSVLATGERPERDTYRVWFSPTDPTVSGVRLEVLTDERLPHGGPGRQDNGNLHLNRFTVWAVGDGDEPDRELRIDSAAADFDQDGWSIDRAIDGSDGTAWGIYPQVGSAHEAVFTLAEPWTVEPGGRLRIEMHQLHGGGHLIGRFRLSTTVGPPRLPTRSLDPELVEILAVDADNRDAAQWRRLVAAWLEQSQRAELESLPPQSLVYCGTNRFTPEGSFRPSAEPRPVRILARGELSKPLGEAFPAALNCLSDWPGELDLADADDEGQRRAALADWLADVRNPLTWRSIANRVWQTHFGRGLVDTPNDFGRMGSAPTHPELLDWLACELREGNQSLKSLRRLIVTSAAYRQAAIGDPAALAIDADNRWLWRFNRRRLDAESFHDAVLGIAGTLDRRMGGPSVKQFIQTPGTHVTPNVDYRNFAHDDPALRRRSVYRFLFRTIPDPFMEALDCPDASQWAPTRNESITAMQALATLNNKSIVWQCGRLAAAIEAEWEQQDPDGRLRAAEACRRILRREPTETECGELAEYLSRHGLAAACRVLINSNEFMFIE